MSCDVQNGHPPPASATATGAGADVACFGVDALDQLMPMFLIVGTDGRIRRAGSALHKMHPGQDIADKDFFDLFDIRRPSGAQTMSALAQAPGGRLRLTLKDGARTSLKALLVPLPDGSGVLINMSFGISVVQAVKTYGLSAADFAATDLAVELLYLVEAKSMAQQEYVQLNQRLQGARIAAEEQAFTDTLTGLKNRRALDHVLNRLIRSGAEFSLMHLDLDFFKAVNDTHGHAAGDEVLQVVAQGLVRDVRGLDTVARVGGDEFVLVFQDLVDAQILEATAQRILNRLAQPIPYRDVQCRIAGSIGIARSSQYPPPPDIAQMIQDADTALYASKRAGRGRFTFHQTGGSPELQAQ